MTEKETKLWEDFRSNDGQKLTTGDLKLIGFLHSKLYNHSYEMPCTCNAKAVKRMIDDINKVYLGKQR